MKRRLLAIPFGVAVVAVVLAPPVRAQERAWPAFRDSLAAVTDVPSLHRLQSRLPMPGLAPTAEPVIERGLIRLRVWELTRDVVDADLATDVFERGAERFPRVAWMQYGLALAYDGAAEARLESPQGITVGQSLAELLHRDPRSRARRAATEALAIDPTMGVAAVLLAQLAVDDGRDHEALIEAKRALEAIRDSGHGSAEVSRALADVETTLGNYADAEAALGTAEATDASGSHARALALLLQPGREEAGARAYFMAVDSLDGEAADRLYRDVEPIVNDAEAADWRATRDLIAKRLWLRRFWTRRAAASGVTEAERLAEHHRRLALARRDFLRNSRRGVNSSGVLLSESMSGTSPFDDRGIVLLRLGVPARVVRTRQDGLLPNETWVYPPPDGRGNRMFHFVAFRGTRDYDLVSDLLQALDPSLDPLGEKAKFDRAIITLIEDRAPYEPRYQAVAARLPSQLANLNDAGIVDATGIRSLVRTMVEGVDADYRRAARRALAADVHVASFSRGLPFHYDLFTFRAPFGRTDLTAAFAVPAEATAAVERDGGLVHPLAISVILLDTLTDEVTRIDSLVVVRPAQPMHAGDFLRVHLTLPVVPSAETVYRVVVRSPAIDAGAVYSGEAQLRSYAGLEMQLSDLVLATPDAEGDWSRGDLRLAVTLPRRFLPDRPFTLFYEIYNIAADAPYRTRVTVEPVQGGGPFNAVKRLLGFGGPRVDLRFDERANTVDDGLVRELRDLGTDLPPGRYRMRVTVTNEQTGDRAESETIFEVIG